MWCDLTLKTIIFRSNNDHQSIPSIAICHKPPIPVRHWSIINIVLCDDYFDFFAVYDLKYFPNISKIIYFS